ARSSVKYALEKGIKKGRLEIHDNTGLTSYGVDGVGEDGVPPAASIRVLNEDFWLRLFLSYDIGFGEAYLAGDFKSPDVKAVLNLYVDNLDTLRALESPVYKLSAYINMFMMRFFNHGLSKAIENAAGYEASNDLYMAFLSKEMQYSVPIWTDAEGGPRGDLEGKRVSGDLETAQARKIQHILTKARLRPGDRLLEVGSGWGGVAIACWVQAAKMGCTVDTLTLATEQKKYIEQKIKGTDLESRIHVHLLDYRNMPREWEGKFDAFCSLEMLEVVGRTYMPVYLRQIDRALKKERSAVVLTGATYPEAAYTPYQKNDFIRKYHWPNGVSPSATSLVKDFEHAWGRSFCLESVEDFGPNYPRCLREWARRLRENWNEDLERSLSDKYPELSDKANMDVFRRKWEYMFVYMEVGYARVWVSSHCWTLVRPVSNYRVDISSSRS
ncbi:cyclopropane-fatty-acyl-phospholipid synthase, partial [Heterobasidion irregulare TC 32-1]